MLKVLKNKAVLMVTGATMLMASTPVFALDGDTSVPEVDAVSAIKTGMQVVSKAFGDAVSPQTIALIASFGLALSLPGALTWWAIRRGRRCAVGGALRGRVRC